MKQLVVMLLLLMIIILNLLKYKNKYLEITAGEGANGILTKETVAVPLKYLSNFLKLLEMPLINCKVELKLKWTKYSCFSAAGADNGNVNNDDNNIFTIKDTKLCAPVVTVSARDNLRDQFIGMIIKQAENKNTTNEFRYFLETNFVGINRLFVLVYPNRNDNVKRFNARKHYLPKGVIKSYNVIMNGKKLL